MNDRVTVDVIIPCFNGMEYIDKCLESLNEQTADICCIIFIDDGSTDESYSVISKWTGVDSRIKVLRQRNRGLSSARNAGIRNSDSTHIAFLDVDDTWLPRKLERQLRLMGADSNILVASNYVINIDGKFLSGITNCKYLQLNISNLLSFKAVVPGSGSSVLIPRALIDQAGFFSETLTYAEDLDYWIRLSRFAKWKIEQNRDVVIYQNPIGMQASRKIKIEPYLDSSLQIAYSNRDFLSRHGFVSLIGYISFVGAKTTSENFGKYLQILRERISLATNDELKFLRGTPSLIALLLLGVSYAFYIRCFRACGLFTQLRSS